MKYILTVLTLSVAASGAIAADFVNEAPAPVATTEVAPASFTWSGLHAGIQGGYGWTRQKLFDPVDSDKLKGGLIGGFVGYNHQLDNNVVIGLEGDVDYNFNRKTYRDDWTDTVKGGTDLGGSVRLRAGYAFDRTLVYATGGWATVRAYQKDYVEGALVEKYKERYNGYTVGLGVEHAFTDNLFGRLEYRYNDFGTKQFIDEKVDTQQHTVKAGLGVKF